MKQALLRNASLGLELAFWFAGYDALQNDDLQKLLQSIF